MVACFGTACPTERLRDHMVACFGTVLLLFFRFRRGAFSACLGPGSCWGFLVSHACPTERLKDHMVACFGTACPTERLKDHMVACFGTVLLLFLAVSKRRFRHPSTDAWHTPWARIMLGFPYFACVPCGALEGPYVACFGTVLLLFLVVSKRRFRRPSTDAWHSPRARILLGFPCFARVPHGALEGPYGGMLWHGPAIVFNGFEEALSAPVYGRMA